MKSIDFKSMLIGILVCACIFLIMGQTSDNKIGRFQLATSLSEGNGVWIHETILDTPTLQDFTSVKSYKENQNEKGRDERKPLDDSKPKEYNWINWDDDKEYT